jgi:hypothetical protein
VSAVRRDETLVHLDGIGDGLTTTWAADDRQLVALEDGVSWGPGWQDRGPAEGSWNSHLFAMSGGPENPTFEHVVGYPDLVFSIETPLYYGFGTLALDGSIYQFLSTLNRPHDPEGWRWVGTKLIYSTDDGRTWHNQDGSTPVRWENWEERSPSTMAFWEESQDAFSLVSFLQMGRGYELNQDGYAYVYGPNGNTDETMTELVMFRVPRNRIPDRSAYEYFAGNTGDGEARWTPDIAGRTPTHVFPRGWVNDPTAAIFNIESWVPSVVYVAPLGLYLMASFGTSPGGKVFGGPAYLGLWTAPNPWGPWTQVHEETSWTPGGDTKARAFNSQIPPKWIAEDGSSFWLIWADFQGPEFRGADGVDEAAAAPVDPALTAEERNRQAWAASRTTMPNYTMNMQRVDLTLE